MYILSLSEEQPLLSVIFIFMAAPNLGLYGHGYSTGSVISRNLGSFVAVGDGVGVESCMVIVMVAVFTGVLVAEERAVAVNVIVGVAVLVTVNVLVHVLVEVSVKVGVGVYVDVCVSVAVRVKVRVGGVPVGEFVGD